MVAFRDEARRETMFQVKPEDFSELFGQDVRYIGMWFEFTEDAPSDHILERLPVGVTPNESYYTALPVRNAQGNLLTAKEMAFPQKIFPKIFFMRTIGCLEEKGYMC